MASADAAAQHHEHRRSSSSSSSSSSGKIRRVDEPQVYNAEGVQAPIEVQDASSNLSAYVQGTNQAPQYNPPAPEGYYGQQPPVYGNQQPQAYYNQQPQAYYNQQPQAYYNQQPQAYYNQQPQPYNNQQPQPYYNQQAYDSQPNNPDILYHPQQAEIDPPHQDRDRSKLAAFFQSEKWNAYNDRNNFIKKVYGILSCQLLFTVLFVGIVVSSDSLRDGIKDTVALVFVAMAMTFILMIAIFCCRKVAKKVPYNYIATAAFTICESYIVAFICAFYEPLIVLVAAIMTLGVTIALTVYAWKTKKDFTTCGGMIFVLCMSFLLFFFFLIFLYNDFLYLIFCLFAVVLYGFFIIYDTQLIAGGRYAELGYDDYILGALMLYIDIIGLFLYLLSILGKSNN